MPHDANGKLLAAGDRVNIPCIVKAIHADSDYCNIDVEFVHPMPAYPDQKHGLSSLNTKQVEKVD